MRVKLNTNQGTKEFSDITLVEQTRDTVFVEDEENDKIDKRFNNGNIQYIADCETIGFIDFDYNEVKDKIKNKYISDDIDKCVFLSPISMAEQKGNQVYIEFKGGDSVNVKGNLDRGYTY